MVIFLKYCKKMLNITHGEHDDKRKISLLEQRKLHIKMY